MLGVELGKSDFLAYCAAAVPCGVLEQAHTVTCQHSGVPIQKLR